MHRCPSCGSEAYHKSGKIWGRQRYKCKSCRHQFTRFERRGYPERMRELSVLLYVYGLSMNAIATLLGVSHQTTYRWIKAAGKACPMPQTQHKVTEAEIDEMCLFLKKRAAESGCGRCTAVELASLSPGTWVLVMREH